VRLILSSFVRSLFSHRLHRWIKGRAHIQCIKAVFPVINCEVFMGKPIDATSAGGPCRGNRVTAHAGIAASMAGSQPSEDRRPVRGDRRAVERPGAVGQSLGLAVALPQLLVGDLGRPLEPLERGPDVIGDDDLDCPE
jgi:hypothetical protein